MDLIVFGTVYLEVVFGNMPALPGPGQEIYTDEFAFSVAAPRSRRPPRPAVSACGPACPRCSATTSVPGWPSSTAAGRAWT